MDVKRYSSNRRSKYSFGKASRYSSKYASSLRSSSHRQVLWLRLLLISPLCVLVGVCLATLFTTAQQYWRGVSGLGRFQAPFEAKPATFHPPLANGRPQVSPLPEAKEVWNCEVIVIGGSLGGVAAATHAMQSGATTCLIELTPWLGGQISAQGVSALDESQALTHSQGFSESWQDFKRLIAQQVVPLPSWASSSVRGQPVYSFNSCWVGRLCFPPQAGANASEQELRSAATRAPDSRWGTAIAFKGAEFDATGKNITAIYAVRRVPRDPNYRPMGRFSKELSSWYSWGDDATFEKIPLRLQARPGRSLMVIDATDTGELVGWAGIPYRLGTESRATTGEPNAAAQENSACTQAITYPFVLGIHDDRGASWSVLAQTKPNYSRAEHRREYSLKHYPLLAGWHNFFNYRRIVSATRNDPFRDTSVPGDMTIVNWNQGNDWTWMNPPLVLDDDQIQASGQRQNWLGGLAIIALSNAENHALLFAQWLLEQRTNPELPLAYLAGADSPMGTLSGLSMYPYIREGRRILGRAAYGQRSLMVGEADLRKDLTGGRDFNRTSIGLTHYAIDIHGCRYRNWEPSGEANSAPVKEANVRLLQLPLESLIPQGVDNLLIGGKSLAVTHIANAVTRTHYSEWTIGAAAGATAAWVLTQAPELTPTEIISRRLMPELQRYLVRQGLRVD